jgi:cell division protein FtsI/penicillin-binding protein 2
MKIITATGALEAGIVKPSDTFPVQTTVDIDGSAIENAGGAACGGTLVNAFALSCNSVFAPLGAKLGAARLVEEAERFGFNQPPRVPGAAPSTIPSASAIGNDLAVGSSAIGEGKVLATPFLMADAAATIAMGGRRPVPTLQFGQPPRFHPVTTERVAGEVEQMMLAAVEYGTGTAAQIPGVAVAGQNSDAWFAGYAPAGSPKIAVGVLIPGQSADGATAAPAARQVLEAALQG